MQTIQKGFGLLFIVLCLTQAAAIKNSGSGSLATIGQHAHEAGLNSDSSANQQVDLQAQFALRSIVTRLLEVDGHAPQLHEVMSAASEKVDVKKVAQRLQQRNLPTDVMALVNAAGSATEAHKKVSGPFSEASLTKAREVLNEMVEASQKELDAKIIDCQTYKEANRATFDQIQTDLARLGEQIADTERMKLEANNGIISTKAQIAQEKESMRTEQTEFDRVRLEDNADMAIKQNDLEVFQFILEFTKCEEEGTVLLQHETNQPQFNICESHDELILNFGDKVMQEKYERKLTPTSRKEIRRILGEVSVAQAAHASLLQVGEEPAAGPPKEAPTSAPIMSATVPVAEGSGDSGELKCPPTPPDCGLLHDKMSLMWGTYKDQVDQLQHEMDMKDAAWTELKANFLTKLKILGNTLNTFSGQLAEATANLNADHEESRSKLAQKIQVEAEYEDYMGKCKVRIEWILFQDICAIVVTRNAVLVDSTVCPTAEIFDCAVEDWVPGTCSMSCDDSCPHPTDPFQCGGWQTLNRRILTKPNPCGLSCPDLTYQKKCNQMKCPVDCIMSEWSDYSKCTKDCEAGVQQRTRDIMTMAKNGGEWCEPPTEQRACNTGSCDRDCSLTDWSQWTPCSMACTPSGGESGFSKRQRDVVVPTRGEGKCPVGDSADRLENKDCNTQPCTGNEECYAVQDLILAIDGSGSLTADNFDILKEYVVNLIKRFKGEINESELMKVGVVQFGNGEIMADGSISNAVKVLPLTSDMASVEEATSGMQYLKGFTNMAQGLVLAEAMFTENGRADSQSAIMVITDGKPSFSFQTQQVVDGLEEKGIQRYFITITESEGTETELMKKWASAPWYTNHLHIPGFLELMASNQTYVQEAVVMFCPMSQSPSVCHAILYQHGNFAGWKVDFPEGAYQMQSMIDRGAPNDDASALKVFGEKCVATLYQHWDFSGYDIDYPEGIYSFRQFLRQGAANDDVSSVQVWKNDY